MRAPRETDLVRQFLDYLRLRGAYVWRQNQGGVRAEHKGKRRFVRFAGVDGISDIIGLWRGRFLAVEAKQRGKEPTAAQAAFLQAVRDHGGAAACVHSLGELVEFLDQVERAKGDGDEHD